MKPAQNRLGNHSVSLGNLMPVFLRWDRKAWPRLGEPGSQARMWTRLVIMDLPILHHPSQMTLTHRNQEIQTTPAQASDQAFAIAIRLGRTERSFEYSDSHSSYSKIQLLGVDLVSIVNQKSVALFVANGLPKLLQSPGRGGMGSDIEMDKSSRGNFHNDKHIHHPEGGGDEDEKSQATIAFT